MFRRVFGVREQVIGAARRAVIYSDEDENESKLDLMMIDWLALNSRRE